ncbi:MAG TPA: YfiR family protein [Thermoanaerobaculia bacterium]|nr:YfiR family protein [Thermoanaerobaculia bacterium]HXT49640.1 YfiR family protein [Thermoanaerobaculia bacterium]
MLAEDGCARAGALPQRARSARRPLRPILALLAMVISSFVAPTWGQSARGAREYDLKATFLFHFTHFVEWPEAAFSSADTPFDLCVMSPDPFGGALKEVVAGERAAGRELRVRTVESASGAAGCQIVFVPERRDSALVRELPGVREGFVLTVGEKEDFLDRGGMVRFELRGGRIRLQVSRRALGASQLQVSSKLLAVADME